jgi:hypothetical protein
MIGINIYGDPRLPTIWGRHVVWKFFNGVGIEFFPILVGGYFEARMILISGIYHDLAFWELFEISKHPLCSFQMSLSRGHTEST